MSTNPSPHPKRASLSLLRRPQKPPTRYKGGEGVMLLSEAREKQGWFGLLNAYWALTLLNLHGRALPVLPVLLYTIYAVGVVVGCILSVGLDNFFIQNMATASSLTTIVGLAVFLLLSFRNQAAYMRWWDGARFYYEYIWIMQGLAMQAVAMYGELYPEEAKQLIWWIIASVEAAKSHFRQSEEYQVLFTVLPRPLLVEFLKSQNKVLFAWYKFNKLLVTLKHASTNEIVKVHPVAIRSYAYCVNIYNTPFPFVYLSHMRIFIYIWLATVPWIFVGQFQWWTILICVVVGFGVLGVEEAAVEVEQPFGTHYNDLPLDQITQEVFDSLIHMIKLISGEEDQHDDEECARAMERCSTHLNSFERRASGMKYFCKVCSERLSHGENGTCTHV